MTLTTHASKGISFLSTIYIYVKIRIDIIIQLVLLVTSDVSCPCDYSPNSSDPRSWYFLSSAVSFFLYEFEIMQIAFPQFSFFPISVKSFQKTLLFAWNSMYLSLAAQLIQFLKDKASFFFMWGTNRFGLFWTWQNGCCIAALLKLSKLIHLTKECPRCKIMKADMSSSYFR